MTSRISLLACTALMLALGSGSALADAGPTRAHVDTSKPTPVIYPSGARAMGEQGAVDIKLQIGENGKPTGRYQMLGTSGHKDLDSAALQSVLNWRYLPATDAQGEPTIGWVGLHVDYKLPPEDKKVPN